jgi:hypothetical protein
LLIPTDLLVVADSRLHVVDCRPSELIRFFRHISLASGPERLRAAANWELVTEYLMLGTKVKKSVASDNFICY